MSLVQRQRRCDGRTYRAETVEQRVDGGWRNEGAVIQQLEWPVYTAQTDNPVPGHASTCTPSPQAFVWLDLPHRANAAQSEAMCQAEVILLWCRGYDPQWLVVAVVCVSTAVSTRLEQRESVCVFTRVSGQTVCLAAVTFSWNLLKYHHSSQQHTFHSCGLYRNSRTVHYFAGTFYKKNPGTPCWRGKPLPQ